MGLFVKNIIGIQTVKDDLSAIINGHGLITLIDVPDDPTLWEVIYTGGGGNVKFGPERIIGLCDGITQKVIIKAVPWNYKITNEEDPLKAGKEIHCYSGINYETGNGNYGVTYDITQCNGDGYFVYGPNHTKIPFPNYAILFHELSHAFHRAIGDYPHLGAEIEAQAINDENEVRRDHNEQERDPTNHEGGCNNTSCP